MLLRDFLAWGKLQSHASDMQTKHISELFANDTNRFQDFSFSSGELLLDLSKQRICKDTLELLISLAEERGVSESIEALFSGESINTSENRPALHTALRSPIDVTYIVDGQNISTSIHANLQKMSAIVEKLQAKQWRGFTGHSINTVVNIGVGGSDLGPLMACKALSESQPEYANELAVHFVSSMDGSQLAELLKQLNPARTLFVISSKSFSTIDTLANAATAKEWLKQAGNCSEDVLISRHFIGVSANAEKVLKWGIPRENQLEFWEWTGGRYSMWSTIGLPIALKIGMRGFYEFLAGAHELDLHFKTAPLGENLPVLLAMVGVWNINFLDISAHAILPYDGRLSHLPAYLEQLEMESNGKSVTQSGQPVDYKTCPILWGEVGTNAQHAFYQLLHQGTEPVMCDFIVSAQRYHKTNNAELQHQHRLNLANCLAQSRLLALGDSIIDDSSAAPSYKRYQGNQPCTTLLLDDLTPYALGQLIALYEQKVFVQSVIWGINPFDQWGVELGKQVATSLMGAFDPDQQVDGFDSSTKGLLKRISERN